MKFPLSIGKGIRNYLSEPVSAGHGVAVFSTPRFFLVLGCYLTALVIFALDPFFQDNGVFVYRQGIVTICFAFVVCASLNWEMLLFGRADGGNLLLQFLQIPPLTLLLARLTAFPSVPSHRPIIRKLFQFLQEADREVFNLASSVPDWLTDLFSNWRISLCFMLVLFILSFRSLRLKAGMLFFVLVVMLASALNGQMHRAGWLIGGTLVLITGYAFQYCRYDRILFFENAVRRIARMGRCDQKLTAVMLSILSVFYENGRISRQGLLQLVKSAYADESALGSHDLQLIGGEIVQKMVFQYGLAEVSFSGDGEFLIPASRLFRYDHLLGMAAVVPRIVMILSLCVLWVLLPVDFIPDGIPFFGVLDDTAVTLMSCFAFQRALPALKLSPSEKSHSISQS